MTSGSDRIAGRACARRRARPRGGVRAAMGEIAATAAPHRRLRRARLGRGAGTSRWPPSSPSRAGSSAPRRDSPHPPHTPISRRRRSERARAAGTGSAAESIPSQPCSRLRRRPLNRVAGAAVLRRRWWGRGRGRVGGLVSERHEPHRGIGDARGVWSTAVVAVNEPERSIARWPQSSAWSPSSTCACSRFRDDSELAAVNASAGAAVHVGPALLEAVTVALRRPGLTGGDVDPTVGQALISLGYDRDFPSLDGPAAGASSSSARAPLWSSAGGRSRSIARAAR